MTIEDVLDHVAVHHPETALSIAQSVAAAAQVELDEVANPNPEVVQAQQDVSTAQNLVQKYTLPQTGQTAPADVPLA